MADVCYNLNKIGPLTCFINLTDKFTTSEDRSYKFEMQYKDVEYIEKMNQEKKEEEPKEEESKKKKVDPKMYDWTV